MINQILLAVLGVTAVFLSQNESTEIRKYAPIFGLLGQPFWFYETYVAEQWGIFVICVFYTLAWWKGFNVYWRKK